MTAILATRPGCGYVMSSELEEAYKIMGLVKNLINGHESEDEDADE